MVRATIQVIYLNEMSTSFNITKTIASTPPPRWQCFLIVSISTKSNELYLRFKELSRIVFEVGTNPINDLKYLLLQIVIKMLRYNGQPVAKLSDTPAKNMCDDQV